MSWVSTAWGRLLLPGVVCLVGCHLPMPGGESAPAAAEPQAFTPLQETALPHAAPRHLPAELVKAVDNGTVEGAASPGSSTLSEQQAMAQVLDELEKIEAIDPGAKAHLMADLKEADPENWPLIVEQFQSALAYRQQLAERQSRQATRRTASKASEPASFPSTGAESIQLPSPPKQPASAQTANAPAEQKPQPRSSAEGTAENMYATATPPEARQKLVATQASYSSEIHVPKDWQDQLQAAIEGLEAEVEPNPTSTGEVHQHMRLRMLKLLAGENESAMTAIPGASSAEQDFWSSQLFAVSTYFDVEQQSDTKTRAAGALNHLDRARAKLAELATLQVRHLTFVESVGGYGVYEPVERLKFKAGEQVVLYAEVENYRSESTKEGYRTWLGTSYEVLDKDGKRVEGAQFPDVEDVCRHKRRDFHMQYGVALPTRIYPDEYELRLTITDHLSQKIGQASVRFEIVE